jgi:AcrR family transcriptional regulator
VTVTEDGTSKAGRTPRGARTHARLLNAAEQIFAEVGYHDASIVKITEAAGVAQGTFYLYFVSKLQVFDELVDDLNRRVRHAMSEGSAAGTDRIESERLGFEAFFRFTAEHPALYRIIRQAEFVSPPALRRHYTRIVEGYTEGLREASDAGQIAQDIDPVVAAWALMGVGELVGMRWVLWDDAAAMPPPVFDEVMRFVQRALGARDVPGGQT